MLRVTAAIEMVLVLLGIAAGMLLNPRSAEVGRAGGRAVHAVQSVPGGGPARPADAGSGAQASSRELLVFLLVMLTALPQLLLTRGAGSGPAVACCSPAIPGPAGPGRAAANLAQGAMS